MRSRTNIFVAHTLAGLFTVFNVGLPIVLFVCPMMNDRQACDCHSVLNDQIVLTYPGGCSCNHTVVAERNTTPFLSATKYQAPGAEVVLVLSATTLPTVESPHAAQFDYTGNTGPPVSSNPIYLLSSALLI
jgi:hypothetical protein